MRRSVNDSSSLDSAHCCAEQTGPERRSHRHKPVLGEAVFTVEENEWLFCSEQLPAHCSPLRTAACLPPSQVSFLCSSGTKLHRFTQKKERLVSLFGARLGGGASSGCACASVCVSVCERENERVTM